MRVLGWGDLLHGGCVRWSSILSYTLSQPLTPPLLPQPSGRALQAGMTGRMFAPFSAGGVRHISLAALQPSDE